MLSSFKSYKIEKIPTAKDLVSSQETTLPFTFPVDLQKHFPHGFLDAQIGVDKSVFQEQSTLGTEYEAVNTTVNELEKKKSEANILKEKLMELFGRKNLKPFQDNQRALFSDKIAELKKEVNLLKEKIKGINLESSLLALILMIVAAAIFISADYIISKSVVSTFLLLDTNKWDAILFSLALAAIPFLLKPAYDRLIEQPYKLNQNKGFFNVLIILITFAAFGLLVNTGFVRMNAFNYNPVTVVPEINNGNGVLLIDPSATGVVNVINPKPENYIYIVVVVSGVLFAFGGAILLGMGLPELKKRVKRAWMKIVLKTLYLKIRRLDKKIEQLNELKSFYERDEAKYCNGISLEEKWKNLMEEIEKTEEELAESKKIRTEKLKTFKSKIHEYGHQLAAEFSESNLKKQGLHYINQKATPRPYIQLRNNISQHIN